MAETIRVERPSSISVKTFSRGEESVLLDILKDAFGSFADLPRTEAALSSQRFDADGCFVAEENGVPIGWVAETSLPRDKWFVIRYLSIRCATNRTQIVGGLLAQVIAYVESRGAEFLRATTPAVQSYVEAYRKFGFKPLRRDFRISWEMEDVPDSKDSRLETEVVSDGMIDGASILFSRALSPYWDWRTEEEGGSCRCRRIIQRGQFPWSQMDSC